jgi:acyl carrier protein
MFDNMTAVQWNAGLAPKVQGAWNLHRALSATPLDFFLVTSSVAGTVGLSSESNYCAANAYLDAFAHHRRQLGLPAISIALGCISEVGYLNERPDVEKGLFRKGLSFYDEDEVIKIVDTALAFANQCNGHIVTGLEIEGVHRLRDSGGLNGTMFDDVRLASLTSKAEATSNSNHTQTTTARSTLERDVDAAVVAVARGSPNAHETLLRCVCELLRNTLAGMLLVDNERVAQEAHLDEFGMDSMLAAEFRTVLSKRLRCDVPLAVLLREGMDISTLGAFVVSKIT